MARRVWAACRPTTNLVGCTIWQLTAYSDALSGMERSFVVQPAATPRGLLNHRMGPLGVPMHQLAGPGLVEPLYGRLVRLHFRHGFDPLTHENTYVLPNEGCYHKGGCDAHPFVGWFSKASISINGSVPMTAITSTAPEWLRLAYFQRTMLG